MLSTISAGSLCAELRGETRQLCKESREGRQFAARLLEERRHLLEELRESKAIAAEGVANAREWLVRFNARRSDGRSALRGGM